MSPRFTSAMPQIAIVGLGAMGTLIATTLLSKPSLRVVAAADVDQSKVGQDVGAVLGTRAIGVTVVDSCEALPRASGAGVGIITTGSRLDSVQLQIEVLLARGWAVISTCEELSQPWLKPLLANRLDVLARKADRPVLGAGINPGYVFDILPLFLSAVCLTVSQVTVKRVVDTNSRRLPLQRKAGVGIGAREFRELARQGRIGHVGLMQSARILADGLGWPIDSWQEEIDPVLAVEDSPVSGGMVPKGAVIGLHQRATAVASHRPVIRYDLEMSAGAKAIDEVEIDGEPPVRSTVSGGINGDIATVALITNLIPVLLRSRPGLLTMRDLMMLSGSGA